MPDPTTADPFRRPSLADTLADTHHCSFFNTSVLIRALCLTPPPPNAPAATASARRAGCRQRNG
jgi:hypothetical protein